ncbi:hypothetical protein MC7420_590 [Coleofasciculus chthonoplastes PCC 7420]|uniref:Uncharacterized protein n=1 Tax=Coleofasciculus chthonoplastes PCC 7420 TaxID=118168 RepID=B4VKR8_9CYAN|nr:hypothetical protein MC7420_590 [Coleofasciculus chthonoplastes PCC 7420]
MTVLGSTDVLTYPHSAIKRGESITPLYDGSSRYCSASCFGAKTKGVPDKLRWFAYGFYPFPMINSHCQI